MLFIFLIIINEANVQRFHNLSYCVSHFITFSILGTVVVFTTRGFRGIEKRMKRKFKNVSLNHITCTKHSA